MIFSVSSESSLNRVAHSIQIFVLLTLSQSFLFNLCPFDACLPVSPAQSFLVRFQPLAQSRDVRNQNFVSLHSGFIVIDNILLALSLLYLFLVRIFSWCDLFQVTGTNTSCVLCLICSPLSKPRSILPIAPGLLHCWHHLMLLCFPFAFICFWLNLIVQFTPESSLSCTDQCKVSTEDSDYVILQMVALIVKIEGNFFYTIFGILLVWRRSDLLNVSLQITGYVSLHNLMPLHITLNNLAFTSHCMSSVIPIYHHCCFICIIPIHWLLTLNRSLLQLFFLLCYLLTR